jgi:ketosteroid isomerase-like protein
VGLTKRSLLCVVFAFACRASLPVNDAILAVLNDQKEAWNAGDVDEFMALGYWHSDELVFVSGESEHHGYDAVLARYKARYTEGDAEMGALQFSGLSITETGQDSATATGRWDLDFEREEDIGGGFALELIRMPQGWRIVRDTTTSD